MLMMLNCFLKLVGQENYIKQQSILRMFEAKSAEQMYINQEEQGISRDAGSHLRMKSWNSRRNAFTGHVGTVQETPGFPGEQTPEQEHRLSCHTSHRSLW